MSYLHLSNGDRLASYSAITKCGKSRLKIEIDVADPMSLGYLLERLAEIETEQKEAHKPAPRRKPLGLPAPPLQLPHITGE